MNIINELQNKDLFTDTENNIVTYINEHLEDIPHMTIGQLSQETYSSNASILRICYKLHCQGFKDFKQQLLKAIEAQKYIKQSIDFTKPFYAYESSFDTINHLSLLYKQSIDLLHTSLYTNDLDQISQMIISSKRLFIYSIGDTSLTVRNFMNKLLKINIYPILATDNHEEIYTSYNITSHDCVLFVTYSGRLNTFIECAHIIQKSHCPIIVLTANEKSPLVKLSNVKIIIPDKEKDERIGTFYSQLAFHYILTIIYALIYKRYQKTEP